MSTQFDRQISGFRFVETLRGDSLQTIAARELGDAARWTEIVSYNKLVPPFITDDPALAVSGVVLTGTRILVPAPTPEVLSTTDPDAVFEKDVALGRDGELQADGVDFVVLSGRHNLSQALRNRIETDRGELIFHPEYGSDVRRLIGVVNGPTASLLAAQYARSAVLSDPRVSRVAGAKAEVVGDAINVTVEAVAVAGQSVTVVSTP